MFGKRARRGSGSQSGYMLLILMLAVALLMITMLGVATNYRQSIRRDREVEMIHRGVQYERAVRLYYRKNNSYPPSIDRLLETNKVRFLRKRYKDPMTPDGAWKIAHLTDINQLPGGTGLGTPSGTGGSSTGGAGGTTAGSPSQQSGATGGTSGGSTSDTGAQGTPASGGPKGGGISTPSTAPGETSGVASSGTQGGTAGPTQATGTGVGDQSTTGATGPANASAGAGELLGGQAMIGVISKSSQEGIHSFNEKSKYDEWLFVYLPSQDVTNQPGRIPNGPFNPKATQATVAVGQSTTTTPGSTPGTTTPGTTMPGTTTPGTMPSTTVPTPTVPMPGQ